MLSTIRTGLFTRTLPTSRSLSTTTRTLQKNTSHTTDTYAKEVDTTPPPTGSTVHRMDPSNDAANVQKPNEKPGAYATAQSGEGSQPYAPEGGQDRRYGGKETYEKDKGSETSHSGEGPAGSEAGGRKPEGKQ